MSNNSVNNKRLAKNTMFMYIRMVFLITIGLYASRVILQTLGISDYGLYNVVGGVVAMFGFLNSTLSTSTQRFLNVEMGKGNSDSVKRVFSNALYLHLLLVIIVFFLAETVGLWFLLNKLVIPEGRETAALWVYQFSIVAVCIQIFQLPFMSSIIAHERMGIYAYVSIYEGLAKLGILFVLQLVDYDKLFLYGALILAVQLSVAVIYNIYSRKSFEEASFRISKDKGLFRDMLGFSGWNIFGNLASVCNSQGLNIVLNLFFGTAINAARGIAFQVHGLVTQLVNNFQLAVKPQVVKYYASGQYEEMTALVFNSAKYSAYLMMVVNIPLILEIRPLLHLWLREYPDYTPIFIGIILFRSVITSMTGNIVMVVHASGYLKKVGLYGGGVLLSVLPISYILLRMGFSPVIPFIVNIFAALGEAFFELYWMCHYINFPMTRFYKEVYGRVFSLFAFLFAFSYLFKLCIQGCNEYIELLIVGFFSVCISLVTLYFFGINKDLRGKIKNMIKGKFKRNN